MEKQILNALYNKREYYNELRKYISRDDFIGSSQYLFDLADNYYKSDPEAGSVDVSIIVNRVERDNPKTAEELAEIIYSFSEDVSFPNIHNEIREFKLDQTGEKLAGSLVSSNKHKRESIRDLIEQYQFYDNNTLEEEESLEVYSSDDIDEILGTYSEDNLIPVFPGKLNELLGGGVPPQTHIVVFGTPNAGKSMFCINMASAMVKRDFRVLFFELEDPSKNTMTRVMSNLTGMTKKEIILNSNKAKKLLLENGYDNLFVPKGFVGTIYDMEQLIIKHEPDAIFVNQIGQIDFKGVTDEVRRLAMAGEGIRRLVKKHDLVCVTVHQADDSSNGKLVLEQRNMHMSKVALPGAVDIAIGIASNQEFDDNNRRMLSLCKDKSSVGHKYFPVKVNKLLSKIRSL